MRTKKILMLALCAMLSLLVLAGCGDDPIGSYKYDWTPPVVENLEFDFYIVTGDATTDNAKTTVKDKINQYIEDKYNTKLNIHYVSSADYAGEIDTLVGDGSTKKSGIVLINSTAMMDSLIEKGAVLNLISQLDTKAFGKLNTQITPTLLEAARETAADGTAAMYCIPNNRVVGSYEYIVIDKAVARALNYNDTELKAMTTRESTEQLRADVTAHSDKLGGVTADQVVRFVSGADYAKRFEYSYEAGYICNVATSPAVTRDDAYASGFAILAGTEKYERAMEIIYAINTDVTLRNYLQYGVEYTNYTVDANGVAHPETTGISVYQMNLLYTGDIFQAHYCDTEGWFSWTADDATYGALQNKDASFVKAAE